MRPGNQVTGLIVLSAIERVKVLPVTTQME